MDPEDQQPVRRRTGRSSSSDLDVTALQPETSHDFLSDHSAERSPGRERREEVEAEASASTAPQEGEGEEREVLLAGEGCDDEATITQPLPL